MKAAILATCGASVLTSCTNDDDPIVPTDEVEAQLAAFIPQIRVLNSSPLLCIDQSVRRVLKLKKQVGR